jgi:hypothetical protein
MRFRGVAARPALLAFAGWSQLPPNGTVAAETRFAEPVHQIAFWPCAISVAAGGNNTSCFADDRWLT